MQLSELIKTSWEQGKIIAINSSGEYRLFEDELTPKSLGYEPLMGIIRNPKMAIVLVYLDPTHEAHELVPSIIKILGSMLNPKLDELRDPTVKAEHDEYMADIDARIAKRQEIELQDRVTRMYRFAEDCVRMELNLRGFPEDEPMLCFSSGNDDDFTYDDDDDTQKVEPVKL